MFLAKIRGNVVSSIKNENLNGHKLLVVREINTNGEFTGHDDMIALDLIDSGIGDTVLVAKEGAAVKQIIGHQKAPVNTIIIAVVDDLDLVCN